MKTLVVKKEIENPKSIYEFVLEFMHGDADGYSTEIVEVSEEHPMLLEFANFMNSLSGRNEADKKHADFFGKLTDEMCEDLYFDYPYDNTTDYSHPASCRGLKIFYYNENGKKFKVDLE